MCPAQDPQLQTAVPPLFRCPISLELMKDPVILSTGITYDRDSIEKWFDDGHKSCPVTMQALGLVEFTPNTTLRRLIRSWCIANGAETDRNWSFRSPISNSSMPVSHILDDLASNFEVLDRLKRLNGLAKESTCHRRSVSSAGADSILAALLSSYRLQVFNKDPKAIAICNEAIATLSLLPFRKETKIVLTGQGVLACLARILSEGETEQKIHAAKVLKSLATDEHLCEVIGATEGVITGILKLTEEARKDTAVQKISISALIPIFSIERNRRTSVRAGAVAILIELLPESGDAGLCRRILAALDLLLSCTEACKAAAEHALVVPAIVKKILRVSEEATDYAVEALWKICKFSSNRSILVEAVEVGALQKAILLLQMESSPSTKQKARELLKLLASVPSSYACEMP